MRVIFIALWMVFLAGPALSAEISSQQWAQAQKAFQARVLDRKFHDYATSFGDFNDDGIVDFVSFVGDPNYNDHGVEDVYAIAFIGNKNGSFQYIESSGPLFGHERVSHVVRIERRSIVLHRDGSGGCCSHWAEDYRFAMRKGRLMLVGVETIVAHPIGEKEPDYGTSVNWLTGDVIRWTGEGKRKRTKRSKLNHLPTLPFRDFSYDAFEDGPGKKL